MSIISTAQRGIQRPDLPARRGRRAVAALACVQSGAVTEGSAAPG
jgi:hypothetical protein